MTGFLFDSEKPVIIYGVSSYLPGILDNLQKEGYDVWAYFDQRAQELNGKLPIPVYTIEEAPYIGPIKKELQVVIGLQNAIQHVRVAKLLQKAGYEKVIFLPGDARISGETAHEMTVKYRLLLAGNYQQIGRFPLLDEILPPAGFSYDCDVAILTKTNGRYTVFVPLSLVYTNMEEGAGLYGDIPLFLYEPYLSLFTFLSGAGGQIDSYFALMNTFGICQPYDWNFLRHRMELYALMNQELNRGMGFFIDCAPPAIWNGKGYFNLQDGQHRAAFLAVKGLRYIPLEISSEDFHTWIHKEALAPFQIYFEEGKLKTSSAPIPHPAFYNTADESCGTLYDMLEKIQRYFGKRFFREMQILECSPYRGFFARHINMQGTKRTAVLEQAEEDAAFTLQMNRLLYQSVDVYSLPVFEKEHWARLDIVFILQRIPELESKEYGEAFLEFMMRGDVGMIVWESGPDAAHEKKFIMESLCFPYYKEIWRRFAGTHISEIGIFSRHPLEN